MIRYFESPFTGQQAFDDINNLSFFIYRIGRPLQDAVKDGDVTMCYFPPIKHATQDLWRADIDTRWAQPIRLDVRTDIMDTSEPFNDINADLNLNFPDLVEREAVRLLVRDAVTPVLLIDGLIRNLIPGRWVERTLSELESAGWFPDPEE